MEQNGYWDETAVSYCIQFICSKIVDSQFEMQQSDDQFDNFDQFYEWLVHLGKMDHYLNDIKTDIDNYDYNKTKSELENFKSLHGNLQRSI